VQNHPISPPAHPMIKRSPKTITTYNNTVYVNASQFITECTFSLIFWTKNKDKNNWSPVCWCRPTPNDIWNK